MPIGEVIAIGGLVLALLASVYGALAYAFRVGALVTTLTTAIAQVQKQIVAAEQIPVMLIRIAQLEELAKDNARRFTSEFPAMRERLASVNEEVDEIKAAKLPERMATMAEKVERIASRSSFAAQSPRTTIPRKDNP